ncbi:hypothetical protein [Nitratireductor aquibiodomus]|uniref:hypothetical protein n=1 Tax=Nitratireductor aquibiodomus TaxID=204799 RepID=UPI000B21670A|nr:hypothetical protein [Nitratireductor aquibiodomus]
MQAKDSAPSETWSERIRAFASGPKPIGFFLFLLIAVTIIPAIGVSVVLLQRNNEAQREVVSTLAEAMAGSIAEAVDRELSGMSTTLRVLSTTPSLASGDLKDFYDRARLALAGSGSYLRVLDENYRLLINTGVPFGEPLTPLNEPETARAALKGGVTITSGVFFGKLHGKWSFKVVKPYFPENGPPRILVMTRNADTLVDVLSQQMLRGGWNARWSTRTTSWWPRLSCPPMSERRFF